MTKDLTTGRPFKLIVSFAIPVFLGLVFQECYNIVDTIIVGRTIGAEALAAVGSTGSILFFILGFAGGLCNGFTIPIAQKFGAKNYSKMRSLTMNTAYLAIFFSVVMTIITLILCRPILVLMKTPIEIIDRSEAYLNIIFLGTPFIFLYNITAGIMRSLGDSKTPFIFLIISSVLNIFLDILFILVFKLDVKGAALATILSQAISGIASLIYMIKKFQILHPSKEEKAFSGSQCKELCAVGIPMGLQYSITAIGSVILQSSINALGYFTVAAVAAAMKIHIFACSFFDALGTTMATYSGQNTGAQKYDRLKIGIIDSLLISAIYSIIAFVVMFMFGRELSSIFLKNPNQEILDTARTFLIGNSAFYITLAVVNVVRFTIQGMGFSKLAIYSGLFEMVARSLMGLFIVPRFGFWGVALASPLAWILADCFLFPAFAHCLKSLHTRSAQ